MLAVIETAMSALRKHVQSHRVLLRSRAHNEGLTVSGLPLGMMALCNQSQL